MGLKKLILIFAVCFSVDQIQAQVNAQSFQFKYDNTQYEGKIDLPKDQEAKAMIFLVHGDGKTEASKNFKLLRQKFIEKGYSCMIYDRAGCGDSGGNYDEDQSVYSSAKEGFQAIKSVKNLEVPGSDNIGFWGLSRAGWIIPLIIKDFDNAAFWISISGPDHYENFPYLLRRNLELRGKSKTYARALTEELKNYTMAIRTTTEYATFKKFTSNLFKEPFLKKLGFKRPDKDEFMEMQKQAQNDNKEFDTLRRLEINVPELASIFSKINCPVLAIWGTKDSQINWKRSKEFYQQHIGKNKNANLTIELMENANHNMKVAETGALMEKFDQKENYGGICPDFLPSQFQFIDQLNLSDN